MAYDSVLWSHPCPEPEGLARGEAVATCLGLLKSWHHHPLASSGRFPDAGLTMVHFSLQPHLGPNPSAHMACMAELKVLYVSDVY